MRLNIFPAVVMVALATWMFTSGPALANTLEALQGAWAAEGTSCDSTFEKVDGKYRFPESSPEAHLGIIVSGKKIVGPNATCTAGHIRSEGDRLDISLSCADEILVREMSVSFRFIDDKHLERFDPFFSDVLVTYEKCTAD